AHAAGYLLPEDRFRADRELTLRTVHGVRLGCWPPIRAPRQRRAHALYRTRPEVRSAARASGESLPVILAWFRGASRLGHHPAVRSRNKKGARGSSPHAPSLRQCRREDSNLHSLSGNQVLNLALARWLRVALLLQHVEGQRIRLV